MPICGSPHCALIAIITCVIFFEIFDLQSAFVVRPRCQELKVLESMHSAAKEAASYVGTAVDFVHSPKSQSVQMSCRRPDVAGPLASKRDIYCSLGLLGYLFDSYAKRNFRIQEIWLLKVTEANGVLDKQVLEAALGKCRPKQRMWGLLGLIAIGFSLELRSKQLRSVILHFRVVSIA